LLKKNKKEAKGKNRPKNQCQHATKKPLFKPQIWIRKHLPKYASEVTEKKADTDQKIRFLLLSLVRLRGTNLHTPTKIKLFFAQICIIRKGRKLIGSLPIEFATPRQKLKNVALTVGKSQ
jgi:hypothetical protein